MKGCSFRCLNMVMFHSRSGVSYKKDCTLHFYKKQFFQAGEYAPRLDSVILIIKRVYMFDFLYMCVSLNVYNN